MKTLIPVRLASLAALAAFGLAVVPAVHAQQSLYVGNIFDSTIEEFNSAGVGTQYSHNDAVSNPTGLAFNSAGDLFVVNQGGSTIEEFNSAGVGHQFSVSGDLNAPKGLAIDSAGNLFVSNSAGNTITEFNSAGVGHQFNVSGDLNGPFGLAFGPSSPAVPEASTTVSLGLLLSLGLGGMVLAAKRKKRAQEPTP